VTDVIAAVVACTDEELVAMLRETCPYLSDEWELSVWEGLVAGRKRQRNMLERLMVTALALAPKDP
jgi:hypothetical protein